MIDKTFICVPVTRTSDVVVPFKIGDKVNGKWCDSDHNGCWYTGHIKSIDVSSQTIHMVFDDGDENDKLSVVLVKCHYFVIHVFNLCSVLLCSCVFWYLYFFCKLKILSCATRSSYYTDFFILLIHCWFRFFVNKIFVKCKSFTGWSGEETYIFVASKK